MISAFRTLGVLLLASAALAASPALAQTSSTSTRLSGVTVVAPAPTLPMVVSTYPAEGKTVTGGVLILKVTFDQKMAPDGWDYGKGADAYPRCLDRPRLLPDEKTFVLLCTAPANARFSVTLNQSTTGGAFANLAGQKASPATLNFITEEGRALPSLDDAIKAAGLKPDEGPVMDSKPGGSAVNASAPAP
jgi:hypothetical protein